MTEPLPSPLGAESGKSVSPAVRDSPRPPASRSFPSRLPSSRRSNAPSRPCLAAPPRCPASKHSFNIRLRPNPLQLPLRPATGEETHEETSAPADTTTPQAEAGALIGQAGDDLSAVWHKMALLNEELAHAILERDQAVNEGVVLREQLRQADEALEGGQGASTPTEELARVIAERDEALAS